MNICAKCQHVVRVERDGPREFADYNWRCGAPAAEPIEILDPVTGRQGFAVTNDLGGFVFCETIERGLPTCRSRNPDGRCQDWRTEGGGA